MDVDPFDSLLNLEDDFYRDGYQLGVADGSRAGYLEGRAFGIEKGFDKFFAMARIYGRATVWAARLQNVNHAEGDPVDSDLSEQSLRPLPVNRRLEGHIQNLMALVDPSTLSMENDEDSVSEFDDRLNRAKAKVKLIEKIIGEASFDEQLTTHDSRTSSVQVVQHGETSQRDSNSDHTTNIEDINTRHIRQA